MGVATPANRAASRTIPPVKAKKLVKRSLALTNEPLKGLRGGKRTSAGWERRIGERLLQLLQQQVALYLTTYFERFKAAIGNLRKGSRGPALKFTRTRP